MENNNNENKTSLLARLFARYHDSKIVRRILGLAITSAMVVTAAGCNVNDFIPSDTNAPTEQTQPNNENNSTNTSTEDSTSTPSNENSKPDLSQYSELLQYVLTDSYYNDIIDKLNSGQINKDSAFLDPHPYAFLEDEGFNIDNIKNNLLTCNTRAFVKENEPNNLYMAVYVETKAENPFLTEYMLKYTLTDKEMEDYAMIHSGNYLQAVFMNDAVSELKTPEVLSETRVTAEAHSELAKNLRNKTAIDKLMENNYLYGILIKDVDPENDIFEVYLLGGKDKTMSYKTKMATIPLTSGMDVIKLDENDALCSCFEWGKFKYHSTFSSATNENITLYSINAYPLEYSNLFK